MTERLYLIPALLGLPLLMGCATSPGLEGEWEGVITTEAGPAFYYAITLDEASQDGVSGEGGISVYTSEGTGADSTLPLGVTGTFSYPEVSLTITGPFPTLRRHITADLEGVMSADGKRIEGTLSSPETGNVELDLTRIERE